MFLHCAVCALQDTVATEENWACFSLELLHEDEEVKWLLNGMPWAVQWVTLLRGGLCFCTVQCVLGLCLHTCGVFLTQDCWWSGALWCSEGELTLGQSWCHALTV